MKVIWKSDYFLLCKNSSQVFWSLQSNAGISLPNSFLRAAKRKWDLGVWRLPVGLKKKKNSVRHLKAFSDFPLISPLRRDSGEQQFYCEEKQRASAAVRAGENGISDMHFVMKMSSSLGESVVFRSHVLQALPLPFKAPFCNDDTLDDIHICKWEGGGAVWQY